MQVGDLVRNITYRDNTPLTIGIITETSFNDHLALVLKVRWLVGDCSNWKYPEQLEKICK
jgi:hypothetical protein